MACLGNAASSSLPLARISRVRLAFKRMATLRIVMAFYHLWCHQTFIAGVVVILSDKAQLGDLSRTAAIQISQDLCADPCFRHMRHRLELAPVFESSHPGLDFYSVRSSSRIDNEWMHRKCTYVNEIMLKGSQRFMDEWAVVSLDRLCEDHELG